MSLLSKAFSFVPGISHDSWRVSGGLIDGLLGTNFVGDYDSKRNFQYQQQLFGYQKDLQQQIFDREDNSVRRRVADLKAAGQNPLLAAGAGAGTGSVVSVSAPNRSTAKYDILTARAVNAGIAKTHAETVVAGETAKNLSEQNANLKVQNDLIKAQTIKTIADATGWTTQEVALKIFGVGFSSTKKVPNKDIKDLHFSEDPKRDDYYHNYLDKFTSKPKYEA